MLDIRKINSTTFGFLVLDPLFVAVLVLALSLGIYTAFNFHDGLWYCWAISIAILIFRFCYNREKDSERAFRQRYAHVHQTKLKRQRFQYQHQYKEGLNVYFNLILGSFIFGYGIYFLVAGYMGGLVFLLIGSGFIYQAFRPRKEIKIGSIGLWSTDFGFIYITDIKKVVYYSTTGKFTSSQVKIYIHNPDLYNMKHPYIKLSILDYGDEASLKEKLLQIK